MNITMNQILDHFFPISGGSALGIITFEKIAHPVFLTWQDVLSFSESALLVGIVGGIGGYIAKRLMDMIWKRKK